MTEIRIETRTVYRVDQCDYYTRREAECALAAHTLEVALGGSVEYKLYKHPRECAAALIDYANELDRINAAEIAITESNFVEPKRTEKYPTTASMVFTWDDMCCEVDYLISKTYYIDAIKLVRCCFDAKWVRLIDVKRWVDARHAANAV